MKAICLLLAMFITSVSSAQKTDSRFIEIIEVYETVHIRLKDAKQISPKLKLEQYVMDDLLFDRKLIRPVRDSMAKFITDIEKIKLLKHEKVQLKIKLKITFDGEITDVCASLRKDLFDSGILNNELYYMLKLLEKRRLEMNIFSPLSITPNTATPIVIPFAFEKISFPAEK